MSEIFTPKSYNHRKYLTLSYNHTFTYKTVGDSTVKSSIDKLSLKTSFGFDGISIKLVKTAQDVLIRPLVIIINQMLNTGIFPDILKIAKICSIHIKMMIVYLPIIGPSHFCQLAQKYLKRLSSNNYMNSSKPTNYFINIDMDLG